MNGMPPPFSRRDPGKWYAAWAEQFRQHIYVVLSYHQLARQQATGGVSDPLAMLFTDQELTALLDQRKRVDRLAEMVIAHKGKHSDDLLVSADQAWHYLGKLYGRVPTTHRIPPIR